MRIRTCLSALLALAIALGAGACHKPVVSPIYRRPAISSVVAYPTVLGPGDSTMITINATDPNGDVLVYDWETSNGLVFRDYPGYEQIYHTPGNSMIFYRSPAWTYPYDTAYVWCTASDAKGGSDSRRVRIFYKN